MKANFWSSIKTFTSSKSTEILLGTSSLAHVMILREVMVMEVLRSWDDDRYRPFNVHWPRDVARHWNVLFLDDGHVTNLLDEHWNLLLDGYLLDFTRVPVVRPRLAVVFALHPRVLLAHGRSR
jgi:hypothetical protein